MAKRPARATAPDNPLERWAFLPRSLLPVLLARPTVAPQIEPTQTFVLQHGDIKFVPWEALPRDLVAGEWLKKPPVRLIPSNPGWLTGATGPGRRRDGVLPSAPVGRTMWRHRTTYRMVPPARPLSSPRQVGL